ncbi:DUF6199 family natural product biosynthesis protein [Saccharibacillus sp. O23]|uniref:DUF6199 family natural product biosynthesis protein n=1 Tax=Saccharibacillus sp. O23 TaxID=2009338 RepID=UPI0035940817
MWLFVAIFVVLGLVGTISPRASWVLSNWWKVEGDAQPSSISLVLYRIGGIVFLLVGIFLIYRIV